METKYTTVDGNLIHFAKNYVCNVDVTRRVRTTLQALVVKSNNLAALSDMLDADQRWSELCNRNQARPHVDDTNEAWPRKFLASSDYSDKKVGK